MAKVEFDHEVLGLITGRTVKIKVQSKSEDGTITTRIVEEYKPFKINDNPRLKDLINSKQGTKTINEIMVDEQLHPKFLNIDYSVFKKTAEEKLVLKKAKKDYKKWLLTHSN